METTVYTLPSKIGMTLRVDRQRTTQNSSVRPELVEAGKRQERPPVLIIDEEESARDLYGD